VLFCVVYAAAMLLVFEDGCMKPKHVVEEEEENK
jgi:hypothetical protein